MGCKNTIFFNINHFVVQFFSTQLFTLCPTGNISILKTPRIACFTIKMRIFAGRFKRQKFGNYQAKKYIVFAFLCSGNSNSRNFDLFF